MEKSVEVKNLYCPVCSLEVKRIFIALCAHLNGTLRQADVTSALLYGELDRKLFVELPEQLKKKHGNDYCWSTNATKFIVLKIIQTEEEFFCHRTTT